MVSTGLKPPFVTWTLASITNRFGTSWTRQLASTTDVFRVVSHATGARLVLAAAHSAMGAALVAHDRARLLEPGLGALGLTVGGDESLLVLVARDAQDRDSPVVLDDGSSCTRPSQVGTSCVGPKTRMLRR
jgi:hypothetical protein